MSRRRIHWLFVALPLVAGGCLLPQPDTPPIGPGVSYAHAAAPAVAPQHSGETTGDATSVTTPTAGTIGNATPTAATPRVPTTPSPQATATVGATASAAATATSAASPSPSPSSH